MTIALYLNDAYLKEMEASVIEIAKESDPQRRWMLVLDQTIFYPRGGGQATDHYKGWGVSQMEAPRFTVQLKWGKFLFCP